MSESTARAISVFSILLTIGGLAVAANVMRRLLPIRIGWDVARVAISVGVVVVMAAVTGVTTPVPLAILALAGGLGLGVVQGRGIEIEEMAGRLVHRRTVVGIVVWGGGILVAQGAGLASRAGALQLGQAVAYFGVGASAGMIVGRTQRVNEMTRQSPWRRPWSGFSSAPVAPSSSTPRRRPRRRRRPTTARTWAS